MKERYGKTDARYLTRQWKRKRAEILKRDHGECVICKDAGRHSRAEIVHHVMHADEWPELFLCNTYTDAAGVERRQLVSVCKVCHETVCHPERMHHAPQRKPVTAERW